MRMGAQRTLRMHHCIGMAADEVFDGTPGGTRIMHGAVDAQGLGVCDSRPATLAQLEY